MLLIGSGKPGFSSKSKILGFLASLGMTLVGFAFQHLKIQLQCHLYLARQVCLATHLPEVAIPKGCIGPAELRVIEGVEPFRAEFEVRAFANVAQGEFLEERQVRVRCAGNGDPRQGSRRIPYSVCGRLLEHVRIRKVAFCGVWIVDPIEPIGPVRVARWPAGQDRNLTIARQAGISC